MAATPRIGSAMLSRLSTQTTIRAAASPRAFSTSVALRAGNWTPRGRAAPAAPARTNPLVGGRRESPKEEQPSAPKPAAKASTPAAAPAAASPSADAPPPPPPSLSSMLLGNESAKPAEQHPYTAATGAKPMNIDIAAIVANKAMAFGQSLAGDNVPRPQIRAKPVTGRTVFIKDRISPTSAPTPTVALRVLNKMVREQQVKGKFHSQRFHERKGLKRKRLASQRWRTRFKSGFKATVNRVLELKRQGW